MRSFVSQLDSANSCSSRTLRGALFAPQHRWMREAEGSRKVGLQMGGLVASTAKIDPKRQFLPKYAGTLGNLCPRGALMSERDQL